MHGERGGGVERRQRGREGERDGEIEREGGEGEIEQGAWKREGKRER